MSTLLSYKKGTGTFRLISLKTKKTLIHTATANLMKNIRLSDVSKSLRFPKQAPQANVVVAVVRFNY